MPELEKFGLQSGLDPKTVEPDIPVLRVHGILSISDCRVTIDFSPCTKKVQSSSHKGEDSI